MTKPLRVLLVEDSEEDVLLVLRQLKKSGYEPYHERVDTAQSMETALTEKPWDLILCDYQMPRFDGLSAIELLKNSGIDIPLIIVSGVIETDMAVQAMKTGACDYIMKDNLSRLVPAIERELKEAETRRKARLAEAERKTAIEALRESEEKYRFLTERLSDTVWLIDVPTMTLSYISPAATKMTGFTPEERMNQSLPEMVTPESYKYSMEVLERELERKQDEEVDPDRVITLEMEYYHKEGHTLWMENTIRPIRDREGTLKGLHGLSRDITERKKAEEALRQSEERFRLFAELAPVGIVIVGHEDEILYLNQKFVDIFGYDLTDIPTLSAWWPRAYPDKALRNAAQRQWTEATERDRGGRTEISPVESAVRCKDGSSRQVEFRMAFTGDLSVVICTDVTERKALEDHLARAQKLESLGTLAGGIAHDFNNLLMGIQGYTSLMLLELDSTHPHHSRLNHIQDQVASGAELTKQLLGFARGGRYEAKVTAMNDIIEKTAAMFGRTKKEVSIHSKFDDQLWNVEVDRTQMEQVFMNLYINAWQAMPDGGKLFLETGNIVLDEIRVRPFDLEPGPYVRISVTDTGVGMDQWTRERVFDPFFSTKPKGRGTGLGLATAYGIIRDHHGMINVYSEPGQGTCFSIYLPASSQERTDETVEQDRPTVRGAETILLVDDEDMVRNVSRELLETLGYRIHAVSSGLEAVALYTEKKEEIDLVILDMIMPGISGGETFDRLRDIDPAVRIILASGYSVDGEAGKIMERGCDAFLQKPFLLSKLSATIRTVLDRE